MHINEETSVLPSKKETIGDVLSNARKEKGVSIADAADVIKIRQQYLSALEENNFTILPGHAYVVGFIKVYADFLGLDGAQLAEQYRLSHMPAKASGSGSLDENIVIEDSAITATHMIIVAVFALIGLGVAYFATGSGDDAARYDVPAVEAEIEGPKPEPAPVPAPPPVPAPAPAPAPVVPAPAPVVPAPAPAPAPVSPLPVVQPPAPAPVSPLPVVLDTPKALPPPPSAAAQAAPVSEVSYRQPVEFGLANKASSRIVLKASGRSWVRLKRGLYKFDEETRRDVAPGYTLATIVMEAGDTYYLPNMTEPDIFFSVGNIEALEIFVDGEQIPRIMPGAKSTARTNIELSPEKLKAGTAYIYQRQIPAGDSNG